jgi:hypothetical protein
MSTQQSTGPSVAESIWAINVMLDYTESIAAFIPRDMLDWRPQYPAGDYAFSLGEQVKHIADTRIFVANNLNVEPAVYERWAGEYPGSTGAWTFREGSYDEVMESLKYSRSLIDPWTGKPFTELLLPSPGTRATFEKQLASKREAGEDVAALEAKGPGTLVGSLLFLVAHENGHRTVLQTLLRQAGVAVERLA